MGRKKPVDAEQIKPGMEIEATEADLGEEDITPPRVKEVRTDKRGKIDEVVVEKGAIFKTELTVPRERVAGVKHGKVKVRATDAEVEKLPALGASRLSKWIHRRSHHEEPDQSEKDSPKRWWQVLGPGIISGASDNDPSGIGTYAQSGATAGYGQLWLLVLATPMVQAVQVTAARIGATSGQGLVSLIKTHYGKKLLWPVVILGLMANLATMGADLAMMGAAVELVTGFSWRLAAALSAILVWSILVWADYRKIKTLFFTIASLLLLYIVTAFLARPNWSDVALHTVLPQLDLKTDALVLAVALLGTTISPYLIFWQTRAEGEEGRGSENQAEATLDITAGMVASNVVSYFVMVTTAATLFAQHQPINTAADAARALQPLAGPLAGLLFSIGIVGAGLAAIPVFAISTSYVVSESFGWRSGLSKRPWQSEGFYLTISAALMVGVAFGLIGIDPIKALLYSQVLSGFLMPILIVILLLVANNPHIMGKRPNSRYYNVVLVLTALVMAAASLALAYSAITAPAHG